MGLFGLATREKSKLRIALTGVSGAGKTLSALYLAMGITKSWRKIAFIDTEHGRGKFYAKRVDLNTGEFYYAEMKAPYSPKKYISYVEDAAKLVGSDGVIIVDSFSHAWNSEGGVLDIKETISNLQGKSPYTAWYEAGKEQTSLINAIFAANCHIIVTMRSKMDYVIVENERGKSQPVKVGLAPIQRDDAEYEFDIVFDIARSHIATTSKDTTFLDKWHNVITPDLGNQLMTWLSEGEDPERCSKCGEVIYTSGKYSVEDIINGSMKNYGKKLCLKCSVCEMRRMKEEESKAVNEEKPTEESKAVNEQEPAEEPKAANEEEPAEESKTEEVNEDATTQAISD